MRIPLRCLLLCLAIFACDRPPTASPVQSAALTSAGAVTPGQIATVRGRNLGGETALLVDGVRVALVPTSDSTAVFTAPHLRSCDTDGRELPLVLASSTAAVRARLHLTTTVPLKPGESRVLAETDGACLQLPAADADFVVSAVNLDETRSDVPRGLADVTTWTVDEPAPSGAPAPAISRGDRSVRPALRKEVIALQLAWPAPYSPAPRLFDPRYSSAVPGDTVRFVDWSRATSCTQPPGSVPAFAVVVVAASGLTVIGVDLRLAGAAEYLTPPRRAFVATAAAIADPLIVPAMRRVFDGEFRPLPSAGGRHFHIITAIPAVATSSDGGTSKAQGDCALASEMVTTLHAPPTTANGVLGPRILATEIIHEYAHNADEITARRFGYRGGSIGWMQESWAVNAEETAARLATGEATRAHLSRLDAGKPYRAGTTNSDWGLYPQRSPWVGSGAYKQGAALLSFARETAGEASLGDPAPSLYLRLLVGGSWTLSSLASEVGASAPGLLDAWALADATDDLSPADVAAAARLRSWDDAERVAGNEGPRGGSPAEARPSRAVGRSGQHKSVTLAAAPGSYAAAYFFAERSLGATLQIKQSSAGSIRVRLTRTR